MTKTTYARRRAADLLQLAYAKPGYVTEEQAAQIAEWQADADRRIAEMKNAPRINEGR